MTDTQTIKDRLDIVQLISEYVPLKKAGVNWRGNCPFHHEKTPSFMVHPEKQFWHCFGCSKGGDIFSFFQEIEGLEFVEALKLLAGRAGVAIDTYQSEVGQNQRNRLVEINAAAANFFHRFLLDLAAAREAREYLERRGVAAQTIADWQIGWAPDQWDLLTKYLLKKGHGINDLVASGLTIQREGAEVASGRGYYDRFRGRIMFPISDAHGTVIGFTGRILVEKENSGGKYVNTPQTILYDKSRALYGLHRAKAEIKAKDLAVLVEGQMDVIACHAAGMNNVVAASGTALTSEQIKLLKRYTNNITMAFDADQAGENAGKRGIAVALEAGMNIKVIQLPTGFAKDADECLKKDRAVWFKAVEEARGVMEWHFERSRGRYNLDNPKEKQVLVGEILSEIVKIPYPVERDEWIKRLAEFARVSGEVLREEAKRLRQAARPSSAMEVKRKGEPAPPAQTDVVLSELWSLIIKFPSAYARCRTGLQPEYFTGTAFQPLYEMAEIHYTNEGRLETAPLREKCRALPGENLVDLLELKPYGNSEELTEETAGQEIIILAQRLKEERKRRRGQEIQFLIAEAERTGVNSSIESLLQELNSL